MKIMPWFVLTALLLAGCATMPDGSAEGVLYEGTPTGRDAETVPFTYESGLIVVRTHITGSDRDYRFILDTGAGATVVTGETADDLNLEPLGETRASDHYDSTAVPIVKLDGLSVGGLGVEDCGAIVIRTFSIPGVRIDGIIGNNFLKHFSVKIEYGKKILTVSRNGIQADPSAYRLKLHPYPGGQIATDLSIGTSAVKAVVDTGGTGDGYLLISRQAYERDPSMIGSAPVRIRGSAAAGAFGRSEGILARADVRAECGLSMKNLPVVVTDSAATLIGSRFLSRFTVYVDYDAMEMFLEPVPGRKIDTDISTYGVMFGNDTSGKPRLASIFEGSAADLAGLNAGDEVEAVFDAAGAELTAGEWSERMKSGAPFTVRVKTANGPKDVALERYDPLPEYSATATSSGRAP